MRSPETYLGTNMKIEIEIRKWVHRGGMFINTEGLEFDDPDHPYQQAKSQGVNPEDFGIINPRDAEFNSWTRARLIDEVIYLRREIEAFVRAGF